MNKFSQALLFILFILQVVIAANPSSEGLAPAGQAGEGVAVPATQVGEAVKVPTGGTKTPTPPPTIQTQLGEAAKDTAKKATSSCIATISSHIGTEVFSILLLAAGILLTFSGKRFLKLFLIISGFLSFGFAGLQIITWLRAYMSISFYVGGSVCFLLGAAGSFLSLKMWELGILTAAGAAGYWFGIVSFGVAMPCIEGRLTLEGFKVACAATAVILCWFFDNTVITFTSAFSGSFCMVLGADFFLKWGFVDLVASKVSSQATPPEMTTRAYGEVAAMFVLFVTGAAVQFVTKANKKGFKSDKV